MRRAPEYPRASCGRSCPGYLGPSSIARTACWLVILSLGIQILPFHLIAFLVRFLSSHFQFTLSHFQFTLFLCLPLLLAFDLFLIFNPFLLSLTHPLPVFFFSTLWVSCTWRFSDLCAPQEALYKCINTIQCISFFAFSGFSYSFFSPFSSASFQSLWTLRYNPTNPSYNYIYC